MATRALRGGSSAGVAGDRAPDDGAEDGDEAVEVVVGATGFEPVASAV